MSPDHPTPARLTAASGLRVLLYGDVDLNVMDGSATWLPSMAETLARTGAAVDVQLKAEERRDLLTAPLRRLDVVAYLRFASVYQAFDDLEDFERAIDVLRDQQAELAGQQTLVPPAAGPGTNGGVRRRSGRRPSQGTDAASEDTAAEAPEDDTAPKKAAPARRRRAKKPAETPTQPRLL